MPLNWSPDPDGKRTREIQRLAEIQLEDVIAIATSGDGRAATLGAAMSAISAGLLVAAVTVQGFTGHDYRAVVALYLASAFFIVAAGLAVSAAAPSDFYLRGYNPAKLASHGGTEEDIVRWATEDLARKLDHNARVLRRGGRLMWASYLCSLVGIVLPAVGLSICVRYQLFFL